MKVIKMKDWMEWAERHSTELVEFHKKIRKKVLWDKVFHRYLSVDEVKSWLNRNPQKCLCGKILGSRDLRGLNYTHEGGIKVLERKKRIWLYLHCPKCGHDLSWTHWKGNLGELLALGRRVEYVSEEN